MDRQHSSSGSSDDIVRYRYLPILFSHGDGPHVWDDTGVQYLDLTGSSGTNILGHREPDTTAAAIDAITRGGFLFDGRTPDEVAVTEALAEAYRAVEVQFLRTGSCATTAAVRVMRLASGRDLVLTSGYHGWHDWAVEGAQHPDTGRVIDFAYDLDVLGDALDGGDVAGIIVTLLAHTFAPAYWEELRAMATAADVPLAVDEVKTGLRYGLGGMAESVGVTPDLTLLSKGLTNGMALSAVVDHCGLLAHAATTNLGGTYRTERTPFAVARAMLGRLEREPTIFAHLAAVSEQLRRDLGGVLVEDGVAAGVFGRAGDLQLICDDPTLWDRLRIVGLEVGLCLPDDGNIMLTAAHRPEHVDTAVEALRSALHRCGAVATTDRGGRVDGATIRREYGFSAAQITTWGTPEVRAILRS